MDNNNYLFLVEREGDCGYDNYSAFVVCCSSEQEARETHPELDQTVIYDRKKRLWLSKEDNCEYGTKEKYTCYGWIKGKNIEALTVSKLGFAGNSLEKGVVLASFHAG